MKNIFVFADFCLHENHIENKLAATHQAWQLCQSGGMNFKSEHPPLSIKETLFPKKPELIESCNMPRRKFTTEAGIIAFFHAIAHIEFVAIYLAWDILYRFRDMPENFYQDWLRVADEEARHFTLIRNYLLQKGVDYGDLPAHRGLWEHAEQTADDLLARLAIVPRCMEARGLDVTPGMIVKCQAACDQQAVDILSQILSDEVGHVALGSYWFNYVCAEQGVDAEESYKGLVIRYLNGKPKGPFNRELRINAGFTETELEWLENSQ